MSDQPSDVLGAFGAATFGELNAHEYDELHNPGTTNQTVALIAELAAPGSALLELAIGSGRIGLPLAQMGYAVSGVEGSAEMVELLRQKSGGDAIPVVIADMADFVIEGEFDHAFLVFNTLFNLTSQEAQIACFQNVARKLKPGGTFLVETFIPDLSGLKNNQSLTTKRLDMNSVWLEAAQYDPLTQTMQMQRIRVTKDGIRLVPLPMRYAQPPEIDLMARLAGFRLKHRWGGWDKSPFTAQSHMHISLYELS